MPELPEVETICRQLQSSLVTGVAPQDLVLKKVEFFRKDLRFPMPTKTIGNLVGQTLLGFSRRAKYLIFNFEQASLVSHLGMSGHWRFERKHQLKKHDHVVFTFQSGILLIYNDPRRFGMLDIFALELGYPPFKRLGPEPFEIQQKKNDVVAMIKKRASPIKNVLLDQTVIAGIGNIYASEILFLARVSPKKKAHLLSAQQIEKILNSIPIILEKAIRAGGSTIRDFAHTNEAKGSFQNEFLVYNKDQLPCTICGKPIRLFRQSGRSTYWCVDCQK